MAILAAGRATWWGLFLPLTQTVYLVFFTPRAVTCAALDIINLVMKEMNFKELFLGAFDARSIAHVVLFHPAGVSSLLAFFWWLAYL